VQTVPQSARQCHRHSTVVWLSLATFGGTGTVDNQGLFEIRANGSSFGAGAFLNSGTLRRTSDATGTTVFTSDLDNSGTVDIQGGTLKLFTRGTASISRGYAFGQAECPRRER
jgi:hypothetical protein